MYGIEHSPAEKLILICVNVNKSYSPDMPGGSKNASRTCQHSPKMGHLRRQAINLVSPRRVRAWWGGSLRLEDAGLGTPNMNTDFLESISDGLNWLPPEPGHTRPDPCTNEHCQLKCVSAQRCPESGAYALLVFVTLMLHCLSWVHEVNFWAKIFIFYQFWSPIY